jgi:hypothetical protein
MNRDKRKEVKTEGNQGRPAPHSDERDKYERHIDGSILVRGGIEATFPPDLVQKHDRERKDDNAQDHNKFVVEIVTLIFVALVALLTICQVYLSWDSGVTAKKQMVASVRPWIGLDDGHDALTAGNLMFDAASQPRLAAYALSLKNYSPYPAQNVTQVSFLVLSDNLTVVDAAMKLACRNYVTNPDINYVIFQGQNRLIDGMIMPYPDNARTGTVQVFISGCIGYRDQFGILYRSGFEWDLRPVGQPQGSIPVDLSKDVRNQSILGEWYLIYSNLDPGTEDKKTSNRQ